MLKKILAITLSIAMLMSVSVFASVVTDNETGKITYEDNFDDKAPGTVSGGALYDGTNDDPGKYSSDTIYAGTSGNYEKAGVIAGVGPDNSNALVTYKHGADKRIGTLAIPGLTDSKKVNTISFDIKFDVTSLGAAAFIGGYFSSSSTLRIPPIEVKTTGDVYIYKGGSSRVDSGYDFKLGTWYKLVMFDNGTTMYAWLLENGEAVAYSYATPPADSYNRFAITQFGAQTANKGNAYIDNVRVESYELSKVAPTVKVAPAIAGQTIEADTETVSVTFDQMLDTTSKATLTAGSSSYECAITQDNSAPYKYTIALPELVGGTDYTLNLTTLKNKGANPVADATYSFKTAAAKVHPVVMSSEPAADEKEVKLDTKTMTVEFNKAMTKPDTVTLTGGTADIIADVTTTDNITFTFTWEENLEDFKTYTVSLEEFVDEEGEASQTASLSFRTENTGVQKIIDDLENAVADNNRGYNVEKNPELALTADDSGAGSTYVTHVAGKTGNALQLKTGAKNACIKTLRTTTAHQPEYNEETQQYEQFVLTYSFNLQEIAVNDGTSWNDSATIKKSGAMIRFMADDSTTPTYTSVVAAITSDAEGNPYIGVHGAGEAQKTALDKAKWYNVVWSIDGINQKFSLIDSTTGECVYYTEKDSTGVYDAGEAINMLVMSAHGFEDSSKRYNQNQTIWIDDFTLWKIKPWKANHVLSETKDASVTATGVGANIDFEFDQPVVLTADMFNVADETIAATFKYPDFCKATAIIGGLKQKTSYEIDYSGVKSAGGADLGDKKPTRILNVTTLVASEEITELAATYTGFAANDTLDVAFTAKNDISASVVAAYYKEGKIAAVKVKKANINEGANTVTIKLSEAVDADSVKV